MEEGEKKAGAEEMDISKDNFEEMGVYLDLTQDGNEGKGCVIARGVWGTVVL